MRYEDKGEVHKDFHLATNRTAAYILGRYGEAFLRELFRRTAQFVYKDLYDSLCSGDTGPLLEHWQYYYERENGKFEIIRNGETINFHVIHCPAVGHLKSRGAKIEDSFYAHIRLLNDGWSEGSPFVIETNIMGEDEYSMIIRRRHAAE